MTVRTNNLSDARRSKRVPQGNGRQSAELQINKSVIKSAVKIIATGITVASLAVLSSSAYAQSQSRTLESVKARGVVKCGVSEGLKGFSLPNSLGDYSGLDADFCRAVASAVFNDPAAVEFVAITSNDRFAALTENAFDLLVRNTTWTLGRQGQFGEFVGVNYYDGQGFMVSKRSGIRSALELDNKTICVIEGTTTELNAADFFTVSKMRYKPVFFESQVELDAAYGRGECTAMTADRSALASTRSTLTQPDGHLVLPEVISKEPLGPVVQKGDDGWSNLVRWSLNCMINAEEMGINSENILTAGINANPATERLLGLAGDFGTLMGVSALTAFGQMVV